MQDLAVSIDDTVAEDVDLDMCSPTAVFADGSKVELKQVSVAEYRAICAKPAGSSSSNVKWTGQHKISHHKLTVTSKADRSLLVVMTEQGAQILQLKVFWFGDEGDAKSVATAFEFMTSIAKRYENDVIKKDDLYAERDNELASRGIHKGKRPSNAKSKATALKKPAAAPTEPHPSEGSKAQRKRPAAEQIAKTEKDSQDVKQEAEEEKESKPKGLQKKSTAAKRMPKKRPSVAQLHKTEKQAAAVEEEPEEKKPLNKENKSAKKKRMSAMSDDMPSPTEDLMDEMHRM